MRYLLILTLSLFSFASLADNFPAEPFVSVTGNASLEVQADQVIIKFQPSALDESGEEAKKRVDNKVALVIKNLTLSGFNSEDIESISQSSRPEYEYQKNKRTLLGIRVTHELSYRLTDIDNVNSFIDAILNAQIKSISPLEYGLQDPGQWQQKVRQSAVLDSKQKALNLAQLYDAKLGSVYSVVYQNNNNRPVLMRAMATSKESDAIKPKNITLTDSVNTVFLLKP